MHQTPAIAPHSQTHLGRHFAKSIKLIILTSVIGALAGALITQFVHPRWLAKMTIQIGQISTPQGDKQLLENQLSATVRYNLPGFRLNVLNDMGLDGPDDDKASKVIFDSLRATPARGPDLIDVQVSAYTPEQAQAALIASFNAFSVEHQTNFEPALNRMKRELETASAELALAESDSAHTYESLRTGGTQGGNAGNNSREVLLTNTAMLINAQIVALKRQTAELQEAVGPLHTYPTRIIGALYIPKRPSTPSKALLIVVGAGLGLLLGAAITFLRFDARRA